MVLARDQSTVDSLLAARPADLLGLRREFASILDRSAPAEDLTEESTKRLEGFLTAHDAPLGLFRSFHKDHRDDNRLEGISRTDEAIVNKAVDRFATIAEIALDWREALDDALLAMDVAHGRSERRTGESVNVYEQGLKMREALLWAEQTFRRWSSELLDELERRHPEWVDLPFEPLDLGPTNSSRLPPVL